MDAPSPVEPLDARTRHRLAVQGFEGSSELLARIYPWHRLTFLLCGLLVLTGTVTGSAVLLWALVPVAAAGAFSPVHPFDLLYNQGIRHLRKSPRLPRRGAPTRFACGLGAAWVAGTAAAFQVGFSALGTTLGLALVAVATLVSTTDICIPSLLFRALIRPLPHHREARS